MRLILLMTIVGTTVVGYLVSLEIGFIGTVKILGSMSRVSIALFGVFGVWLGLSYRDEIVTGLWRDNHDVKNQRLKANLIKEAYSRCKALFLGFKIAAIVFVISWIGEVVLPLLSGKVAWLELPYGMIVRRVLLAGLDTMIVGMMLAEIYSVVTSIWPIRYITQELKAATKAADIVLMETSDKGD